MIQTFTRKRIDILVDAPLCDWLAEVASEAGIDHYTLLAAHSGRGRSGRRMAASAPRRHRSALAACA